MRCLRQRWPGYIRHSAWAEPLAVTRVLQWLRRANKGPLRVAVVTDHAALESGQRRWFSGNGGFSHSHHLNEAYKTAYADGWEVEFFHINGEENPADGPSRDVLASRQLDVVNADVQLPSLRKLRHSHRTCQRMPHMV
jgi:hypothetical protein